MLRRLLLVGIVGAGLTAVAVSQVGRFRAAPGPVRSGGTTEVADPDVIGNLLYPPTPIASALSSSTRPSITASDPVIIPDCRLTVVDKQDVPSQRDGVLLFIGTEIEPGQTIPPDQVFTVRIGGQDQQFRRLKEGDRVKAGQLLGYLDDRLSRDDWAIKNARVASSRADLEAALKTSEESRNRYDTQLQLLHAGRGATAEEDVRSAKLTWDRAAFDVVSKREAVTLAERELSQAETVLRMHQLRSTTAGVIKSIAKKPGEAVKSYEAVFQIHDLTRLRVEGLVDVQCLPRLRTGMQAVIEPCPPEAPHQTFLGHFQEITGVAVRKSLIVSASADGTARVWDRPAGRERAIFRHPTAVLAVAAADRYCLTGAADGTARLWSLDGSATEPLRQLEGQHTGGITSVAFSPDGRACVTGGEDRAICLWDTASGALRYRFPAGHRGAITALQFTPQAQLVSVSRDQTLRLWTVGEQAARAEAVFHRRGGEVTNLGVRPDGRQVLFDQGNTLRLLSLPEGRSEGALQPTTGTGNFTTFALFSPDGRLVLAADQGGGRVQLWRAPTASARAAEVRRLVAPDLAATCAAWAPDGSILVVGTRDRQVHVWPVPAKEELERQPAAEVSLIERAVESSTPQVRIWAELPNPEGRLLPGTTVTMVLPGE